MLTITFLILCGYYRQNFVKVDIYYGEMKTQQITQAPAYDVLTFFSKFNPN